MSKYKDNLTEFEKESIKALERLKEHFSDPNHRSKVFLKFMEDHIRKHKSAIDELASELGLNDDGGNDATK